MTFYYIEILTINKMANINVYFAFYLIDRILKNTQYSFALDKNIYICDINKRSFFAIKIM